MWSLRLHFTNKSVTGAPYSIESYSLSHSWTLWWRVRWLRWPKQCRLEVAAELTSRRSSSWWRLRPRHWPKRPGKTQASQHPRSDLSQNSQCLGLASGQCLGLSLRHKLECLVHRPAVSCTALPISRNFSCTLLPHTVYPLPDSHQHIPAVYQISPKCVVV